MLNEPIAELTTVAGVAKKSKLNFRIKSQKSKKEHVDARNQIYKIVLTGILLALAVGLSLLEIRLPIMGANVPIRIFDITIMAFAIPIIGLWYACLIGMIEPWLHFMLDSDHPPIQMLFDNFANITLILSFYLVFYKLLKIHQSQDLNRSHRFIRHTIAASILIVLNALVASLCFAMTLIVLANTNFQKPEEYIKNITLFYQKWAPIFFILFAIEFARFTLTYCCFSLIQRRLAKISRI